MAILKENYSLSIKHPISKADQYHLLWRKTLSKAKQLDFQQLVYALKHDGLQLYQAEGRIKWEERFWAFYQ